MINAIADELERLGCEAGVGDAGLGWEIQQNPREFETFARWCMQHFGREQLTMLELGTGRTGGLGRFCSTVLGWQVTSVDINIPHPRCDTVEFVQSTTAAAYPYLRHRVYDIVFIDADHAYHAVKFDHELYAHMGRIVAFHDVAPARACCEGTYRYWNEVKPLHGDNAHEVIAPARMAGIGWYVNPDAAPKAPALSAWAKPLKQAVSNLTVLSGTYNRLPLLRSMIESARASVPDGITLDFVIVDGGSTDGTLDYLRAQSDVTLLEHGALLGPKKAFTDGGKLARGTYVCVANDDITFIGDALYRALCYLETHHKAGGVALAFTDPNHPTRFVVNQQGVTIDGRRYMMPYAQVGVFRRELAHAANWWGDDDPAFECQRYGLDNYLTSRILELGYTVDALPDAHYHDHLPNDALRAHMAIDGKSGADHPDAGKWAKRFNGGFPIFGLTAHEAPPVKPQRLRILYAPIYADDSPEKHEQRRGWLHSLQRVGIVTEFDYVNHSKRHGNAATKQRLVELAGRFAPHLLLTQVHAADRLDASALRAVRNANPNVVIVNWNGDESRPLLLNDAQARAYMRGCDLNLIVNGALFPLCIEHGIRAAWCQSSFEDVTPDEQQPAHDVVYLGNAGRSRAYIPFYGDDLPRLRMERLLRAALPDVNIGFYGHGWDISAGANLHNWKAQYGLYANAKLTIVDNQYPDAYGYFSDRIFKAFAYAQCVFLQPCEGLELLYGLRPYEHYIPFERVEDLPELVTQWLAPECDDQRRAIGDRARAFVRSTHHYDARTRQLFEQLAVFGG